MWGIFKVLFRAIKPIVVSRNKTFCKLNNNEAINRLFNDALPKISEHLRSKEDYLVIGDSPSGVPIRSRTFLSCLMIVGLRKVNKLNANSQLWINASLRPTLLQRSFQK